MGFLEVLSQVIGWIYFFAWSLSFYGQLIENYKRKSVEGYKLDFQVLNLTGFTFYAYINVSGYIGNETNPYNNYGLGTIKIQDMLFAVHAIIIVCITGVQCLIYPRGRNKVTKFVWGLVAFYWTAGIFLYTGFNIIGFLKPTDDFTLYLLLGYLKLSISIIKYIPPVLLAYYNYKRKSTVGWSIMNILLDFTGGLFSMLQTVIDTIDGTSEFVNPIKFLLGNIAMVFDVVFMIQHYVLYADAVKKGVMFHGDDSVLDEVQLRKLINFPSLKQVRIVRLIWHKMRFTIHKI